MNKPNPQLTDDAKAKALQAIGIDNKSRWHWLLVHFNKLDDLRIAMPLADYLHDHGAPLIYFSRYTSKPFRVEIKCQTSLSSRKLKTAIKAACAINRWRQPVRIIDKPFNGSITHALAFLTVKSLEQTGGTTNTDLLRDVTHWMYNMAGFSYAQEAESVLREAHMGLMAAMGSSWHSNPSFANPKLSPKSPKPHPKTK